MENEVKSVILPKVPSELLVVALRDMKLTIEQGYNIDMDMYGQGRKEEGPEACAVCFAGAVMLQTTLSEINRLYNFAASTHSTLPNGPQYQFLDSIREGHLRLALDNLNLDKYPTIQQTSKYLSLMFAEEIEGWVEWEDCENPEQFYTQIEELIEFFKSINL